MVIGETGSNPVPMTSILQEKKNNNNGRAGNMTCNPPLSSPPTPPGSKNEYVPVKNQLLSLTTFIIQEARDRNVFW